MSSISAQNYVSQFCAGFFTTKRIALRNLEKYRDDHLKMLCVAKTGCTVSGDKFFDLCEQRKYIYILEYNVRAMSEAISHIRFTIGHPEVK